MNIRTSRDPVSLQEVRFPETHPCVYEGDGDNGIAIYFENEENRQEYLKIDFSSKITLEGNDSVDYVAQG